MVVVLHEGVDERASVGEAAEQSVTSVVCAQNVVPAQTTDHVVTTTSRDHVVAVGPADYLIGFGVATAAPVVTPRRRPTR